METLSYWIGMAGTVAFAVTAVLALAPRGIDLFGACVMGIITAIGGGTVRDLILDVPVFWAADLNYIWVALGASLAAFSAHSLFTRKEIYSLMVYIDGFGGGLIRDVLAGRQTLLMSLELYATPVLFGCTLYVVLLYLIPQYRFISAVCCCLFIFGIRAAAIHWQLSVPEWLTTKTKTA